MDPLLEPMRGIRPGMSGRRMLPELLSLVVREGVMERARALSVFGVDELCESLHRELGYDVSRGNRRRMIRLLVDLLAECGWLQAARSGDRWSCRRVGAHVPGEPRAEAGKGDGQVDFLRRCLRAVPGYLRGEDSPIAFDSENMHLWEEFLGCDEFQACRSVLLDRMASLAGAPLSLLDLCHGPGWGIERAMERCPEARISAIDFTDAFTGIARDRAERAVARNASRGLASPPVGWFGPSDWKGFGHPLPFPEDAFGAILFSCGDPYIRPDEREAVYSDLRRVLAPGGTLGILTRGYPDPQRLDVALYWLRVTALIHDFTESVCAGWHGFPDVAESREMFTRLGFRGAWGPGGAMSVMGSAVWILTKA